tara:strand:- start:125 stop:394 length:270 start_codon:yes stop_codon:yes gene_type:complete
VLPLWKDADGGRYAMKPPLFAPPCASKFGKYDSPPSALAIGTALYPFPVVTMFDPCGSNEVKLCGMDWPGPKIMYVVWSDVEPDAEYLA